MKYVTVNSDNVVIAIRTGGSKLPHEVEVPAESHVGIGYVKIDNSFIQPQKTKEEEYNEIRSIYIQKIRDAETLGETDEVNRLRQEWQQIKINYGY